jgi:putative endonuclease
MFVVYALYNYKHKKLYIGQTRDIELRIKFHEEKIFKNSFTSRFDGRWNLIYKEEQPNRSDALIREKQLKSYRGREFIKKLIPNI